jgi:hypothetical protein
VTFGTAAYRATCRFRRAQGTIKPDGRASCGQRGVPARGRSGNSAAIPARTRVELPRLRQRRNPLARRNDFPALLLAGVSQHERGTSPHGERGLGRYARTGRRARPGIRRRLRPGGHRDDLSGPAGATSESRWPTGVHAVREPALALIIGPARAVHELDG